MAEIKSFPNNQDEYSGAEDVMRWLHGRTSGVFAAAGNAAVAALATPGMAVTVSDGTGWMANAAADGVVWWNDSESVNGSKLQLTIDAADGVLNRIDRVIVEWKTTNYVDRPEIKVLKGTASSTAAAPALTNNGTKRQISLAQISVAAGTTAITAGMITDERQNTAVCGLVTESLSIDTSVINAQFAELLSQLRTAIEQAGSGALPDGTVTTPKYADKSVTLTKLANDARFGIDTSPSGTTADIESAWGNALVYVWQIGVTITLNASVIATLPTNWHCRIFAGNSFTFSWSGLNEKPVLSGQGKTAETSGSVIVPANRYIDLRRSGTGTWIFFGNYADRYISAGTADPTGGNDGDIYIQYSE